MSAEPTVSEESRRLVDEFGAAEQRVIVKDTNASVFSAISARDALLAHISTIEKERDDARNVVSVARFTNIPQATILLVAAWAAQYDAGRAFQVANPATPLLLPPDVIATRATETFEALCDYLESAAALGVDTGKTE